MCEACEAWFVSSLSVPCAAPRVAPASMRLLHVNLPGHASLSPSQIQAYKHTASFSSF